MSLITTIYLVSILTTLRLLAISIFLIVIFMLIVCCVFWMTEDEADGECFSKYFSDKRIKYYKATLALSLFLFVAIPPQSNMYAMLAIKAGENIYQSEIGQKGLELLSLKLDELLPKPKAN